MRNTLLLSAALLGLACGPVLAQNGVSSTMSPPSPNAGQGMPEPTNSLPAGAGTATRTPAGDSIGTTVLPSGRPAMGRDMGAGYAPPGRMRHGRMMRGGTGMDEANVDAPRTGEYRGGAGSPRSNRASNITPADTHSEIAPRLPNPDSANNTPEGYLAAAQRALASGKTGAAQEALERAETRVLSRSTDPSAANSPADMPMVQQIGQARRALAARDIAGARTAINAAMSSGS